MRLVNNWCWLCRGVKSTIVAMVTPRAVSLGETTASVPIVSSDTTQQETVLGPRWEMRGEMFKEALKMPNLKQYCSAALRLYPLSLSLSISLPPPALSLSQRHQVCYLCGGADHISSQCPNDLCTYCYQEKHRGRSCSAPWSSPRTQCLRCFMTGHHASVSWSCDCHVMPCREVKPTFFSWFRSALICGGSFTIQQWVILVSYYCGVYLINNIRKGNGR